MKNSNILVKWFGRILIFCSVIFSLFAGYIQKVHADYYSQWTIISVSGVKQKRIMYQGVKPLIQLYQDIKYRRTYVDKAGRSHYHYQTVQKNIGLKSPYVQ